MNLFILLLTFMTLYKCAIGCGEKITFNAGVIQSSDIPTSDTQGQTCSWVIQTPDNTQLVLVFKEFHIGDDNTDTCGNNYIQMTDGLNGSNLYGKQLCGTTIPAPVVSLNNVVHVNYTTTRDSIFQLEWKVIDMFEYHNTTLSWLEAVQTCAEDGGSLTERSSFTDIQIQHIMNSNTVDDIWTGTYLTPWSWLTGCVTMTSDILNSIHGTSFKANQHKICQNHCHETNFYGLKGTNCYCLDTYTGTMAIPAVHCKDGCPGNHDERCGGDGALTLYRNDKCWDISKQYAGSIANTYSGRTCLQWNEVNDRYSPKASNYCRDPLGKGFLWCFTSLPNLIQKCTIPGCLVPKASKTQHTCMKFKIMNNKIEAHQTTCDDINRYVCRELGNKASNGGNATWQTSRDRCRHKRSLLDTYFDSGEFYWLGCFRNKTSISDIGNEPNNSPDYCYNMEFRRDEVKETNTQCNDRKTFICQTPPITCGDSIHAYTGNITYPSTGNGYGPLLHCLWTITVDTSSYDMTLHVDIEPSYKCKNDFLKIYHGNTTNKDNLLEHVCGQRQLNLTRLNGTVTIQFKSDMTIHGSGFNIAWLADEIPTTTLPSTTVSNGDVITKKSNDQTNQNSNGDKNATPGGVIAGICVGLIVMIAIVIIAFIVLCRRNKQHQVKRKETVSTILTLNPDNVNTHPYDINASINTTQLYGNLDAENLATNAHAHNLDKSSEGIYEDEDDGDNSTRETRFSEDPQTYHVLIKDEYSVVSKVNKPKDPESNIDVYNTLNESLKAERAPGDQENVYNHLNADQDDNIYNHTDTMNETLHQLSKPVADETYSNKTGDTDDGTYSHLQNDGRGQNQAVPRGKQLAESDSTYSHVQKY